ncbi:YbaB/EbfC family nucleoid-associated protein [Flammeovirgaceae bacterium SG7u.111]|nr:YbaB/EbfC family nucleoid-associated protein [Flammeovirgaceae bacterium SG7u.132]WPO34798.1 YbaB/EbfC family nucleoid-associated protein [Flammeovirgaceae bacterium SG7u.111]
MDMMDMMGKLKDVQAKLKEAQSNLVNVTTTAESGAGMVKATVNGLKQVVELELDDSLLTKDDKDMLQDLIIAAVNKAMTDVDDKAKEEMKKSTQGFIPNIPGFDFGNL